MSLFLMRWRVCSGEVKRKRRALYCRWWGTAITYDYFFPSVNLCGFMKSKMIHNLIIYHFFSCPSPNRFGDDVIIKVFPCGSAGKESACDAGDLGSIPGLGRSPGEGKGYPLQYSGLENSMDCIVPGVTKSWTRLSDFHEGLPW